MTATATALWDQRTGSRHERVHELFAGNDAAGAEQGCTFVALAAPDSTGALSIAWFTADQTAAATNLTYLGQTSGLETDEHESIYTYSRCPDIQQIPHSPIAIPPGMPELPDDNVGIAISIAAPGYEIQSGVGQDLAFGSKVPGGPAVALTTLIISSTAVLALTQSDNPETYQTFSTPFTPPAPGSRSTRPSP